MTTTILTALSALITGWSTAALVAPSQETVAREMFRAEQPGRAMAQTHRFGAADRAGTAAKPIHRSPNQ